MSDNTTRTIAKKPNRGGVFSSTTNTVTAGLYTVEKTAEILTTVADIGNTVANETLVSAKVDFAHTYLDGIDALKERGLSEDQAKAFLA